MPHPARPSEPIAGVILAGGQGRRFGGLDKALLDLDGRPLLAHVVDRFAPQVAPLVLSANGDADRFRAFGLAVVADPFAEAAGPLAGVAAAGLWLRETHPDIDLLASIAVDTPRLPRDLVPRLAEALARAPEAGVAVAASHGRTHPVAALHRLDGLDDLVAGLADGSIRRVMRWVEARGVVTVTFEGPGDDPFLNLNRPEDLDGLRRATS